MEWSESLPIPLKPCFCYVKIPWPETNHLNSKESILWILSQRHHHLYGHFKCESNRIKWNKISIKLWRDVRTTKKKGNVYKNMKNFFQHSSYIDIQLCVRHPDQHRNHTFLFPFEFSTKKRVLFFIFIFLFREFSSSQIHLIIFISTTKLCNHFIFSIILFII